MVNTSKEQHRMKNKNKKFNHESQRTRHVQYFKRTSHKYNTHQRTIPDQIDDGSLEQMDMISGIAEGASAPLLMPKHTWYSFNTTTSNIDPTLYLSDYSTISNQTFKEIVSKLSISTAMGRDNSLEEFLDTDEKVTFTRQLIQLINRLNYFKLQDEQWTYYYDLGMTEGIWCGRVSKNMAAVNSMCYTYGRRKTLIQQRQRYFREQLIEITDKLSEHLKQASHYSVMNTDRLLSIANDFIDQEQYRLRMEVERHRAMLKFDAKDHQLVGIFYGLKPRRTEIHSTKIIWKTVQHEQILRYEIALFKHWFASKRQSKTSTPFTFQDLHLTKINTILTSLIFDQQLPSKFNLDNNYIDFMDDFLRQLTEKTISIAEHMAQLYVDRMNEHKQKILNKQTIFKKPPTVDSVITAIENRRQNMVERTQYNIQQTLKILFEDK